MALISWFDGIGDAFGATPWFDDDLGDVAAASGGLSAVAAATLVLTSAAVATDPLSAPAAGTLVLTSAAVATDPLSGAAAAHQYIGCHGSRKRRRCCYADTDID
jgi:hypothetical protein